MQCLLETEGERVKGEGGREASEHATVASPTEAKPQGVGVVACTATAPGLGHLRLTTRSGYRKKLKTAKKAHNFLMRIYIVRQANDRPRALKYSERDGCGEREIATHIVRQLK